MSVIFAENYKKNESTLPESVIETAKAKFKQHKAIIIKGPRKCGKTTLAALLTSIYQPGEFLIIYKADDMKYISLDKVCLVVVEDFAGKYRYDNVGASDWMRAFDMLSALVKAGKLNVILTCEDTFLAKCKEDFDHHPIFDNAVKMEESDISIKQEKDEKVTSNLMPFSYNARERFVTKKRKIRQYGRVNHTEHDRRTKRVSLFDEFMEQLKEYTNLTEHDCGTSRGSFKLYKEIFNVS